MVTTYQFQFDKANEDLKKAEIKVGKLQQKIQRERITTSTGSVWFVLLVIMIIGLQLSAGVVTDIFGSGNYLKEGIYVYVMFFCVITINVLLIIPYMARISKQDKNKGYLSTGVARGTSRFRTRHQNIFQQLGQEA